MSLPASDRLILALYPENSYAWTPEGEADLRVVARRRGVSVEVGRFSAEAGEALVAGDLAQWQAPGPAKRARLVLTAEGRAQALLIMAEAEAARIRKLDEAMNSVCAATQQRELVLAAGEVVGKSQSTLILANSLNDVSGMLGANQLARQAALAAATR
jgi:hypothetical protein